VGDSKSCDLDFLLRPVPTGNIVTDTREKLPVHAPPARYALAHLLHDFLFPVMLLRLLSWCTHRSGNCECEYLEFFCQLNNLSQIIEDALNAADLSHGTASSIEYLICAILPFHPGWSTEELEKLVKNRGQLHCYNLGDRLSDADIVRIAPILLPVLKAWEIRELPSQAAYPELIAWDAKNLHRDVRVSLLRALWEHLEREETWSILEGAAISDESNAAIAFVKLSSRSIASSCCGGSIYFFSR
jgi:hypothetical protein